jgi:hypothetical protein
MNPYILTKTGTWPFEKYTFSLNESDIDFRNEKLPVDFIFSPMFAEDNNYASFDHNTFSYNTSLLGLSSNYKLASSELGDINLELKNNLNLTWTPSSFRNGNYGDIFSCILLRTKEYNYYGIVAYPSKLFLYPTSVNANNGYSYSIPTEYSTLTAKNNSEINNIFSLISKNSAEINISTISSPLISSINYYLTSNGSYETSVYDDWTSSLNSLNSSTFVYFLTSKRTEIDEDNITLSFSSFSYTQSSNFVESFIDYNSYFLSLNEILTADNYYFSTTNFSNITSIEYKTFIKEITSSNYFIQTSSVLLEYDNFQFTGSLPASTIKTNHSNFLSKIPSNIISLKDSSINNVVYTLSGNITRSLNKIIDFTEIYNPVTYNKSLEKNGVKIRPDTCRLCYDIKYYDYITNPPTLRTFGDSYDDFDIKPDRSIGGSYIINQKNNILTFQMYQSSLNDKYVLEDSSNCILSSVLNLDNSNFKYVNTWKSDLYGFEGIQTPISGIPGTYLGLRYIAEVPYISETETLQSSICSISSFPSISINSPLSLSTHNNTLNWTLKYPPYYYIFKSSYNTNTSLLNYTNNSSLMFYLSSTVLSNTVDTSNEDIYENKCEIYLYTSIYSDFDIIELPLNEYGFNDYIKYELVKTNNSVFDVSKLKAYIIDIPDLNNLENFTVLSEYDFTTSPYIPATKASFLKLVYNIGDGGGLFTLKPTLSTKVGIIDSYWCTSFPVANDVTSKNYIKPFPIQTIFSDITSTQLSIEQLTSVSSIDLSDTEITWIYDKSDDFIVKNITPETASSIPLIESGKVYNFNDVNLIEIVGLFQTPYNITLSSFSYEAKTTKTIYPELFELYYENTIIIEQKNIDLKNDKKLLRFDCKVPLYNKTFNIGQSSTLLWNWDFNFDTNNQAPVSAYTCPPNYSVSSLDVFLNDIELNRVEWYQENTLFNGYELSSLFVLIDVDKTIIEQEYPFNIRSEVRDRGKNLSTQLSIQIKSHPSPDVFSSDFKVNYPNFLNYDLINTESNLNTLTRPPNGTNLFYLEASKLNSLQSKISSMKWVIDTIKTPLSSKLNPTKTSETINLVPDLSGFFDADLLKDFNVYNTVLKSYQNLQIINPLSTSKLLTSTDVDLLNSYIDTFKLAEVGSVLNSMVSSENITPLATSIYLTTTSLYVSFFDSENERQLFLNNQNDVFSFSFFTQTLTDVYQLDGENEESYYDVYSLNLYTSSIKNILTDDQTAINSFFSNNIIGKTDIFDIKTYTNKTSSFNYTIYEQEIEKESYYENKVSLILENVSLLNWSGLYNFKTSANIIIPAEIEFSTSPDIFVIPRFVWNPEWKQKNKIARPEFNFVASGSSKTFNISGTDILTKNSDISVILNNLELTPDITFPTTYTVSYISDGSTKTFNVSGLGNITNASYIQVYADSVLLTPTTQYTLSSNVVTLSSAIPSGFRIDIYVPIGYNLDNNVVTLATFPDSGSIIKIYGISDKPIYKNMLANKFVSILDNFDKTDNHLLTGKTYGNMLSSGEYNIIVQGIQDTDILLNDPIELVFGVGDDSNVNTILEDQILNDRSDFILNHNEIYVENFVLPSELNIYDDDGMTVYLTAFNRFFPNTSSVSYYGINELSSSKLEMFTYPITAKTHIRKYDDNGIISGNIISYNPRLYDYEPFRFLFYPETTNVDLDSKRIIKVKQIIETIPNNSPNILQYDKSSVVYVLSSDFWTATTTVPAISNGYVELFKINTGDPSIPLTVSDYGISNLVLTASATIASQITNYTFSKYTSSEYTGERNLWGISYQTVIGNENYPTVSLFAKYENTFNIFDTISSV